MWSDSCGSLNFRGKTVGHRVSWAVQHVWAWEEQHCHVSRLPTTKISPIVVQLYNLTTLSQRMVRIPDIVCCLTCGKHRGRDAQIACALVLLLTSTCCHVVQIRSGVTDDWVLDWGPTVLNISAIGLVLRSWNTYFKESRKNSDLITKLYQTI